MARPEEDLLRRFRFQFLLNQDTSRKSATLLGTIDTSPALLIAEKTAFNLSPLTLATFPHTSKLPALTLMERNDIYHWYLASQSSPTTPDELAQGGADVKLTLIYPATDTHVRKYSQQNMRMVTETPEIYTEFVRPYVEKKRTGGRLNWVYNILEHKAESERIIVEDTDEQEGFILLPDLKWDRKTMASMYTMALVQRRDMTSLRDLKKKNVPWLKTMQRRIVEGICKTYPSIEHDQIKLYIHYQPSYYHFHIHAVSIAHDGGTGQTVGKALLLGNVISQLETMAGGGDAGFADVELTYFLGEESELWQGVFEKLRQKEKEEREEKERVEKEEAELEADKLAAEKLEVENLELEKAEKEVDKGEV